MRGDFDVVAIPAGEFLMGDPPCTVHLEEYSIGRTLVSVRQFKAYCIEVGLDFSKFTANKWNRHDNHPMVNVTCQDARDFCEWYGGDLPTEEQWEKAARGTDGLEFPWGNVWYPDRLQWKAKTTAPIDAHPTGASPFGCLDMAGNAWQWCHASADATGQAPEMPGERMVLRGGNYFYGFPDSYRTTNRFFVRPDVGYRDVGFRICFDAVARAETAR